MFFVSTGLCQKSRKVFSAQPLFYYYDFSTVNHRFILKNILEKSQKRLDKNSRL
jgi:hypothetical protein